MINPERGCNIRAPYFLPSSFAIDRRQSRPLKPIFAAGQHGAPQYSGKVRFRSRDETMMRAKIRRNPPTGF